MKNEMLMKKIEEQARVISKLLKQINPYTVVEIDTEGIKILKTEIFIPSEK